MGLREDIEKYREPTTRMVGISTNPPDHSCDNGLLFSATYLMVLSLNTSAVAWDTEMAWFLDLARKCQVQPGLIRRYPGDLGMQAHDDMIGMAAINPILAREILDYGLAHHYSWNTEIPGAWTFRTFFYRMGAFVPFLKARSGFDLNWIDKLNVAASFYMNTREGHDETSGRCLLWLMHGALLDESPGWIVTKAINFWKGRMNSMYSYGVQELYGIYFGKDHPLAKYAPRTF